MTSGDDRNYKIENASVLMYNKCPGFLDVES